MCWENENFEILFIIVCSVNIILAWTILPNHNNDISAIFSWWRGLGSTADVKLIMLTIVLWETPFTLYFLHLEEPE